MLLQQWEHHFWAATWDLNDHFLGRESHFWWKIMKIQLLRWTSDHLEKKVPVAAAAWTLFYFCNPSNVLSPLWTPKLIFREVNSQYYWGPLKSHLQRKKTGKSQLSLFHWFWTPSPPHLGLRGQIGRRIVERMEGRLLPLLKNDVVRLSWGGKWSLFGKRITFFKSNDSRQVRKFHNYSPGR